MRKFIFFAAIAAIGLVACNKSSDTALNNPPIQKAPGIAVKFRSAYGEWGLNNTFAYDSKGNPFCYPVPNDCFDEIVKTPNSILYQFANLIAEGDFRNAAVFANTNLSTISEYFTESDLMGFINGEISVNSIINKEESKTFLFFKNNKDETNFTVYPFVFKD